MRLEHAIYLSIIAGGPGSGCHGDNCGRPETAFTTKSGDTLQRLGEGPLPRHLKGIRIPPAWTDVFVNQDPKGSLMVAGKDSKGRAQYLYSEKHTKTQSGVKFARIISLEKKMPAIIKKNEANQKKKDPEVKDSADALALIIQTGIRPGSDNDTGAEKQAYGATTLLGRHVNAENGSVLLNFIGKKGVALSIPVEDKELAASLIKRADKAGYEGRLFPNTDASKLLSYTKKISGSNTKTKDFRTLLANRIAAAEIAKATPPTNAKTYKQQVKAVASVVAAKLGNTAAIALASYIQPKLFAGWKGMAHA